MFDIYRLDIHENPTVWADAPAHAVEIRHVLGLILENQRTIMIDTSKILAEVARERTELAGWKTLSAGKDKILSDTSAALKVATDALAAAGVDTAALAKVQTDLDAATADLKNDNDEAETAIKANVATAA